MEMENINISKVNSSEEVGRLFGAELRQGPIINRRCSDSLCIIAMGMFLGMSVYLSVYSFVTGDPERLLIAYDSDRKACGAAERKDYKYLYFVQPYLSTLQRTVCVKSCPAADDISILCYPNSQVPICNLAYIPNIKSSQLFHPNLYLFGLDFAQTNITKF